MKKNQLIYYLAFIMSIITANAQNEFCPGNFFDNGDLEIGTPTNGDQDINLAQGFSAIWPTGSLADFYASNAGPFNYPTPATGNYAGLWITNVNGNTTYREGLYNTFLTPLAQNSGSYTFSFDVACLYKDPGSSTIEIGIYGIDNSTSSLGIQPTSMTTPSNLNLFPGNTILLGTISMTGGCSNTKQSQSVTINTNGMPLANITNIMITKSDTLIDWGNGGGKRYIGVDNFCLAEAPSQNQGSYCCGDENLVTNGNFEFGNTGFLSDYAQNAATYPGEYDVTTSTSNFNAVITDQSFCDDPIAYQFNDHYLVVNGKTQQPAGSTSVIWEQTVNVDEEREYKLCANFKNMPQCTFDILPEIRIELNGSMSPWYTINTDATDACDWQEISDCINSGLSNSINIKIHLKEDGNGDGNDVAVDDISLQQKLDQNLSITVQHQGTPQQITASINTINTADDAILVRDCAQLNGGYEYYWFVYELSSLPLTSPISNMVPNTWSWSSNLGGFSTLPLPANPTNPVWNLTTTFPNYNFEDNKPYVIGMYVPACCDSCYEEAWAYQLTFNGSRSNSSNDFLSPESKEFIKSMFRSFDRRKDPIDITIPISVFPNPGSDIITIDVYGELKSYEIYNLSGKRISGKKTTDKVIDVSQLKNSVYFIKVELENGDRETIKFIKE